MANQTNETKKKIDGKMFWLIVLAESWVIALSLAGGAYIMHKWDEKQTNKTNAVVQQALKSIPIAQAEAPKQ